MSEMARVLKPGGVVTIVDMVQQPFEESRSYVIRRFRDSEAGLLKDFLYEAIFIPDGVEPPEKDIMHHPPYHTGKSLFSGGLGYKIAFEGAMIGALALMSYVIGNHYFNAGSTMTFAVLSLSQLVHSFHMRSDHPLADIGFFTNPKLLLSFVLCAFLQIAVITIPFAAEIFSVTPLSVNAWCVVAILSLLPLPIVELQKRSQKA